MSTSTLKYLQSYQIKQFIVVSFWRSEFYLHGTSLLIKLTIMVNLFKRYQKQKLFNNFGCLHIQQQTSFPEGYKKIF